VLTKPASVIAIETPKPKPSSTQEPRKGLFLIHDYGLKAFSFSSQARAIPSEHQSWPVVSPSPRRLPLLGLHPHFTPRTLHSTPLHTTAPHTTAAFSIFDVRLSATFLHDQPGLRSAAVTAKSQRIASTRSPITRPERARRPLTSQPPTKSQYSKTLL